MKIGKLSLLASASFLFGVLSTFAPLACRPRSEPAANAGQWNPGTKADPSFDWPERRSATGPRQSTASENDEDLEEDDEGQSPSRSSSSTPYVPSSPPASWHSFRSVDKGGGGNCGFCSIGAALGMDQQQVRNEIDSIDLAPNAIAKHELARRLAAAKNDFEYGQYYRAVTNFGELKNEIKRAGVHQLDIHSIRLMEAAHNVVVIAVRSMNLDTRTYTFNYGCFGAVNNPSHVVLLHGGRGHYTALEHAQTGSNGFSTAVGDPAWPDDVQRLVYDCYRMSSNPMPAVVEAKVAAAHACWARNTVCGAAAKQNNQGLCEAVIGGEQYCLYTAAQGNICRAEYDLCGWYSWTGTQNNCEQGIKFAADNSSFCQWNANAHYGNKHCFAADPVADPCHAHDGDGANCKAALAALAFGPNVDGWVNDNRKLCSYRNAPAVCKPRRINPCSGLTTKVACEAKVNGPDSLCEWRH